MEISQEPKVKSPQDEHNEKVDKLHMSYFSSYRLEISSMLEKFYQSNFHKKDYETLLKFVKFDKAFSDGDKEKKSCFEKHNYNPAFVKYVTSIWNEKRDELEKL